jgi:histidine triad (HIT) family protein
VDNLLGPIRYRARHAPYVSHPRPGRDRRRRLPRGLAQRVRSQAAGLEHLQRHHPRAAAARRRQRRNAHPDPHEVLTGSGADCAFCAIIRGDVPAEIVHADPSFVAFLDHRPLFYGHTLLVPREHVVTLAELPTEAAGPYLQTAQRLERAVESAMGSDGSMVLVNNVVSQSVPHLHLHVIPRKFTDGLRFWLGPRRKYGDDVTLAETGHRIREALTALG